MKVLIAGGGTGGHLFPGIALARALVKKGCSPLFVGTSRGLEEEILRREGFPFLSLRVRGFIRKRVFEFKTILFNLRSMLLLLVALSESFRILLRERPRVVVGMGGYPSFPVLLTAWLMRRPTLICEQNLMPGLASRILSYFVDEVHIGFEETRRFLRRRREVFVSGNPVRREIVDSIPRKNSKRVETSIRREAKTVLLFGGSRGAHSINRAFLESLSFFPPSTFGKVRFILQTGKDEFSTVQSRIQGSLFEGWITLHPFIEKMGEVYGQADLVVSRAGATTCAEITAVGLPALLIPYPFATEGHQMENALYLKRKGAAEILKNGDLSGERLARTILSLLQDEGRLREMGRLSKSLGRTDAAERIADRIVKWLKE